MYKKLLCGAAALGLMTQAGLANGIIINGVPHTGGGTVNVPYGHGAANCCETAEFSHTLPVISYQNAPAVTTHAAPAVTTHTAPIVTTHSAPANVVTHQATPIVSEQIINIRPTPVLAAPAPVVVAAPAAPIVAAAPAAAGWSSRVYVGARGGWSNVRDTSFTVGDANVDNEYDEVGYNVAAVVGWGAKISNGIGYRLEAELGYQTADIDSHTVGKQTFSSEAGGETNTLYGFANAYLDVPIIDRLNGVVGGGVGIGRVEFDNHSIDVPGIGTVLDDEDTVFGYHLDAGLSYDVTDRLAVEAIYRYTNFADVELTSLDGVTSETDVDSHNVLVGARYGF